MAGRRLLVFELARKKLGKTKIGVVVEKNVEGVKGGDDTGA